MKSFISVALSSALLGSIVLANPQGGNVVAGSATISQESATKLNITQTTDKAIINWQKFDIEANEHTQFIQPSSSSITLNRVISNDPSRIMGKLTANGGIFIINQNGILFGKNSQIDVSKLVASTHDISNENFMKGNYKFDILGKPNASIINEGTITIGDYGIASFVAPSVRNSGVIVGRLSKIALASGNSYSLDMYGDNLINFIVDDKVLQKAYDLDGNQLDNFVENSGKIISDGGYIALTANVAREVVDGVINHDGIIEANSVSQKDGVIILDGGDNEGIVEVDGRISATNSDGKGGHITITGDKILLNENANIDASGKTGGTILVGGDYLGGSASDDTYTKLGIAKETTPVSTANYLNMAQNAIIKADSTYGDGGKIVLWSDIATRAYGTISSNSLYGNGGFIEVSGKEYLDIYNLNVTATANNGNGGTILFDPGNIHVVDPSLAPLGPYRDLSNFVASGTNTLPSSYIEGYLNSGTNVVLKGLETGDGSSGNIYIKDSIQKTSGADAMLSLFSADEIEIYPNVEISSTFGKLDVYMDADYDRHGVGQIYLKTGSSIKTNGGFINLNYSSLHNNGTLDTTVYFSTNFALIGQTGQVNEEHVYYEHIDFTFLRHIVIESPILNSSTNKNTSSNTTQQNSNESDTDSIIEDNGPLLASSDNSFIQNSQNFMNLFDMSLTDYNQYLLKSLEFVDNLSIKTYNSYDGFSAMSEEIDKIAIQKAEELNTEQASNHSGFTTVVNQGMIYGGFLGESIVAGGSKFFVNDDTKEIANNIINVAQNTSKPIQEKVITYINNNPKVKASLEKVNNSIDAMVQNTKGFTKQNLDNAIEAYKKGEESFLLYIKEHPEQLEKLNSFYNKLDSTITSGEDKIVQFLIDNPDINKKIEIAGNEANSIFQTAKNNDEGILALTGVLSLVKSLFKKNAKDLLLNDKNKSDSGNNSSNSNNQENNNDTSSDKNIDNVEKRDNLDEETISKLESPYDSRTMRESYENEYGKENIKSHTVPPTNKPNVKLANKKVKKTITIKDSTGKDKALEINIAYDSKGFPVFDNYAKYDTNMNIPAFKTLSPKQQMKEASKELYKDIKSGDYKQFVFFS
jgi:filamentous hemagglutinin family protein